VDLAREDDRIRGEVQVWAKIDHGVLDRLLRVVAPVLGGLLDRKLQEQFGLTFRVAEHASRDPARFCQVLAGTPEGSRDERQTLASVAACPGTLPGPDFRTSAHGILPPATSSNDTAWPPPQPRQE